jgi:hypothetical protein
MKQLAERLHDAALEVQTLESVCTYKQTRLDIAARYLCEIVAAVDSLTPTELIREINPNALLIGRIRKYLNTM